MVVFFLCAVAAELKPLSLDIENTRVVSLAFIFIVSGQVLFGWEYGVAIGAGAMLIAQVAEPRPAAAAGVQLLRLRDRDLAPRRS